MASPVCNIVILGAGVAGVSLAHQLLRHVLTPLGLAVGTDYRITLVAPSRDIYWKIGAPRAAANPSALPVDDLFMPIDAGFGQYNDTRFKFVEAKAEDLDPARTVIRARRADGEVMELLYDVLVVASGTSTKSPLFSSNHTSKDTRAALEGLHGKLETATSVVIVGGGPVGVETAGELGQVYGSTKEISLISGNNRLLPVLQEKTSKEAEARLTKLGVTVSHGRRVSLPDGAGGGIEVGTSVVYDNGETIDADVVIDATGCYPNTTFLPSTWLDDRGYVKTVPATLRLDVGAVRDVYALGSVTSFSNGTYFDAADAVLPLAETIRLDQLRLHLGEQGIARSSWPWPFGKGRTGQQLENKPRGLIQLVPCGKDGGVGEFLGWRVPSYFVYLIKAKTFMIEKLKEMVEGQDYR
jgi:NADH dehydrogenase FAD-containing subunit